MSIFLIILDPIKKAEKIEKTYRKNSDQQTLIISTSSLSGVILLLIVGLTLLFYIQKRQNTARIGKYLMTPRL